MGIDLFATDDLTIILGLIAATVFLLISLYKPQPLVHPILLGRQSDVGRARNPTESAVYRNYGTGMMGRFPVRPAKEVHIVADLLKPNSEAPRTLWTSKITNSQLQDRVAAFGTGLLRLAQLQPHESNVLLLLNDSLEFILADMALASHSIPSFTLSSPSLLSPFLDSHSPSAIITHAFLLPQLLELIYDAGEQIGNHTIVVVGEPTPQAMASVASSVKILKFTDVEREGVRIEKIISPLPKPSDIFTLCFYESISGQLQGTQVTHDNLTAGVVAVRALFPFSHTITSLDTIVSAHPLSTLFGRAIAYTAIYEGTSFATLRSSELYQAEERSVALETSDVVSFKRYPIPSPTLLFIKTEHLLSISPEIHKHASHSWLYSLAQRHKLAGVKEGFMTKESLWDRLVFDGARSKVLGDLSATLRGVVISGGPIKATQMTPARIAFSVPLVNCFHHPQVVGPILASHWADMQDFVSSEDDSSIAHVGPPTVNVEIKLIEVDDAAVESGADPVGFLLAKGPSVGNIANADDYIDVPSQDEVERWAPMGVCAKIQRNGSFQVLYSL